MSEQFTESQYTRASDNLEYEEDYIEEQVIYKNKIEPVVNYPPTRTATRAKLFSSKSNDYKRTPSYHVKQAENALKTLKSVVKEPGWERIQTHKSGVVVYSKHGISQYDRTPVFMGEHVISGVSPQSVFAVIGMRKLWDDWYEEGTLVENLNDTTSSTYMVMQAFGYKSRDLSLVEKIECTPNGSIFFAATSIDNPKVPHMDGRIRANVKLNGWILEPIPFTPPKTKITYVIQAQVNGWIPSLLVKKYMTRRPLVLGTIDNYLKKNGPPPMIISATPPPSRGISTRTSNVSTEDSSVDKRQRRKKVSKGRRRSLVNNNNNSNNNNSNNNNSIIEGPELSPILPIQNKQTLKRDSPASSPTSLFKETFPPSHASIPRRKQRKVAHRHAESAQKAINIAKTLASDYDGWNLHSDSHDVKIFMKDIPGRTTPQMRGETIISGGFTPEDILSVIINLDMRKLWDDRFEEGKTVERLGEDDDILARVCMKGTFPISGRDLATISKVEKDPETNTIWLAGTSVFDPLIPESKKHVRADLNVSGWRLQPVVDEFGQPNSIEVIYIVDIDIKLESIPSSILKSISVQTPMCVARIDELIKKTGHPPYIKTSSGTVISEGINTKTYQYDLTVGSIGDSGVTEIKVSKIMFPFGFNIFVIPESSNVELSPDGDVVRITLPTGTGIETLNVKITKNLSKNLQYTFNGVNILTGYLEEVDEPKQTKLKERIVEPLSPPETPAHPTHDDNTFDEEDNTFDEEDNTFDEEDIIFDEEDIPIAHSEEVEELRPTTPVVFEKRIVGSLSSPEIPAHLTHDDSTFDEEDIPIAHSEEVEGLRPTTPVEFEKRIVGSLSSPEIPAHPTHDNNTFDEEDIPIAHSEEVEELKPTIPLEFEKRIVGSLSSPEIPAHPTHDDNTFDEEDIPIAHSEEVEELRPATPVEFEKRIVGSLSSSETPAHPMHDDNIFDGEDMLIARSEEDEELRPTTQVEFEKKIVEPLSPTGTPAYPVHDNNETPSTNATLVARDGFDINLLNGINAKGNGYVDEKVLNEYDQLKHDLLGRAQRGAVTPNTFKPIEEVQKATTSYEIFEEKDSKVVKNFQKIDYSIPEPDPSAKKYVPSPIFALDTTKYIPEPIFMRSSETYTSDIITSPSTEHTTISAPAYTLVSAKSTPQRRISSRMVHEHMLNQAQFYESNSDENVKSSPQQRSSRRISSRMMPEHMMNQTQFHESNSDENAKPTLQQRSSRRISSRMMPEHMMNQTQFYEPNDDENAKSTPQRRSSRRISSRMMPEHMMNQTQFYGSSNENSSKRISFFTTGDGSNKRIGIILGKKEVSFSPQEASLMFVFMILAYYAGKSSTCNAL